MNFIQIIIIKILDELKVKKIGEIIKILIPHFYHILPKCPCIPSCNKIIKEINLENNTNYPDISFCFHINSCFEKFNYLSSAEKVKIKYKKIKNGKVKNRSETFHNLCCCKSEPEYHDINYIFKRDFTNEENNNEIRFRRAEIIKGNKNIPQYEKMELLVGKNKFVLDALDFLYSDYLYLNVFGDKIDNLIKFGSIIKEYYLERYNFYESNKNESKRIKEIKELHLFNEIEDDILDEQKLAHNPLYCIK